MGFSRTVRAITDAEKRSILLHLKPKPRWLSRFVSLLFRDGLITEGMRELEADYRAGLAEVLTVEVDRYAIGEEYNDEGPICFFEIGRGNVLVLWGQWLLDPHVVNAEMLDTTRLLDERSWFKRFALVRGPESGLVLSLKGLGCETILSVGTIACGQTLPSKPSLVLQVGLDAMLKKEGQL